VGIGQDWWCSFFFLLVALSLTNSITLYIKVALIPITNKTTAMTINKTVVDNPNKELFGFPTGTLAAIFPIGLAKPIVPAE
jgi:hypothetical protein